MWLFSEDGYLSIVDFDPALDKIKTRSNRERKSWGANPKMVRARVKEDLERLRPFYSKLRIETDPTADYKYRAIVPLGRLEEFFLAKLRGIDYNSHVKETFTARAPKLPSGVSRYAGMSGTWSATSAWQDTPPYGGYTTTSYGTGSDWYKKYQDGQAAKGGTKAIGTSGSYPANWSQGSHYSTATYDTGYTGQKYSGSAAKPTDNIKGLCQALVMYGPHDIPVAKAIDTVTPEPLQYLAEEAGKMYNGPLTAKDMYDLLESLAEDTSIEPKWNELYQTFLHQLDAQMSYDTLTSPDLTQDITDVTEWDDILDAIG